MNADRMQHRNCSTVAPSNESDDDLRLHAEFVREALPEMGVELVIDFMIETGRKTRADIAPAPRTLN